MATGHVVTTVGKGLIAASMAADHTARFIAMGTGTNTPAVGDTALQTPVALNAGAALQGTDAVSGSVKYRVTKTITSDGAQTISEVGLFKESAMTNMLYREVFAGLAVLLNDTVSFTIDITVG
jgi:hypothetical protein